MTLRYNHWNMDMTQNGAGKDPIGNIDLVKQLNGAVVYRLIDQQGPISRIQIAEHSQLAPASVTKITRQLLERGLIKEVEQQASTGGRRAISIISETRLFHSVAIRLGRKDATIALYDLSGRALAETCYPLPVDSQESLETALFEAIHTFIADHERKIRELIAISIALPGLVDPDAGIVKYMPHLTITEWPLAERLEQHFHVKCFVGHDIRSLALAEHYFGATQDCEDSILVRVHRGTGAGIIVKGNTFLSHNGNVGEIGHIQVEPLGERCHCGNFGCLETIVANSAIEQRVRHLIGQGFPSKLTQENSNIETICEAANQGDLLAKEVIENVGHNLGKAISITINLFNPQKVVIAGHLAQAESVLLPAIQTCINTQVLKDFRENLPIVTSSLQHQSAIGAFALVKRAMLNGTLLQLLLENT